MNRAKTIAKARETLRNKQLNESRMRVRALEETNSILSSYLGLLITRCGSISMPKNLVSEGIGNFEITVTLDGDNYLIKATTNSEGILARATDIAVGEEAVSESEI